MIKKIVDLTKRGALKRVLHCDEKILDVYFLVEEKSSTHNYLTTIVIRTPKGLYVAPRSSYSLESTGGGRNAIKSALNNIFEVSPNFNDFHIWCAKNEYLDELEDETILEYRCCPFKLQKVDCPKNGYFNIEKIMQKYFEEIKNEVLNGNNQ